MFDASGEYEQDSTAARERDRKYIVYILYTIQ